MSCGILVATACGAQRPGHRGVCVAEPSDITRMLNDLSDHPSASGELYALVYDELRTIARSRMRDERSAHTLQATALVHEVFVRLVGSDLQTFEGRGHFFRVAAEAMRRVLIDHARKRDSQKRGGTRQRIPLHAIDLATTQQDDQLLDVDAAITQLASEDARAAEVIMLRFYAGLTVPEVANAMRISERTVMREWSFGRARLLEILQHDDDIRESGDDG
ncbi:MAG: ECF-type sigma factor [Planctomycetota bacterium]